MLFPFQVGYVGVFRDARRSVYVQSYHAITLNVYGLRYLKVNDVEITSSVPSFILTAKGTRIISDCGPGRETWGLILRTDHIRPSKRNGKVDIQFNDSWTPLLNFTQLGPENLPGWQREMAQLRELFLSPTPLNIARMELGALNILRFIMDRSAGVSKHSTPAHQLKTLLDCPELWEQSLLSLSRRTGYSPEHMRDLFRSEFGLSPGAYRMQSRMAKAMEDLANSRLSIKEIAYRLGFKHQSHFSQAFRHAFGFSPRYAIAKYRSGSG